MRRMLGTLLLTLLMAAGAAAQAEPWNIDRAHSAANFSVRHFGVSTVRGSFTNIAGTVLIDDKTPANSSVDVTIDVNTVNTANEGRDKHLRSADFFDVANHPSMTFKSKKVEAAGAGRLRVIGDLTIRGTTKEVVLDVEGPTPPVNAGRGIKRGATATTKINRREFGLNYGAVAEGVAAVGDEITITIDLELNKAQPRAAN